MRLKENDNNIVDVNSTEYKEKMELFKKKAMKSNIEKERASVRKFIPKISP